MKHCNFIKKRENKKHYFILINVELRLIVFIMIEEQMPINMEKPSRIKDNK